MKKEKNFDKLEVMMTMQHDFQNKVGFNFEKMGIKEKSQYIKEMMLWVDDEMKEALHELPFAKGWSKKYDLWSDEKIEEQMDKFRKEMVDSFHFFMNILIASDMDAEKLFNEYLEKNKINIERQNNGY